MREPLLFSFGMLLFLLIVIVTEYTSCGEGEELVTVEKTVWQYELIIDNTHLQMSRESVIEQLNSMGKEGWELVSVVDIGSYGTLFVFKKRV